jgi:predicted amidophosphoribosyltransferase
MQNEIENELKIINKFEKNMVELRELRAGQIKICDGCGAILPDTVHLCPDCQQQFFHHENLAQFLENLRLRGIIIKNPKVLMSRMIEA